MIGLLKTSDGFILSVLIPIIGMLFDFYLPKKVILILLAISVILLLPLLTGYNYIYLIITRISTVLLLVAAYAVLCNKIGGSKVQKIVSSVLFSVLLFFILGFMAFAHAMAGYQKVEQRWEMGQYRVDYVKDQGFAGGAYLSHELYQYGLIPIYIKKIETIGLSSRLKETCIVDFESSHMLFNKCNGTVKRK